MLIRADLANRLQPAADRTLRPALPVQEVSERLSGFVAGQRLLAEIQSQLPDGSYRALINQRSLTLALPFAASSGDAIELEVAESNGKLTMVARTASEGSEGAAVATRLSRTGQLISNLLAGTRDAAATPLPLKDQQTIAARPPGSGQDLLPLLREAISESGMFYESHQAKWVEGRYHKAQLLLEPQGKLSPQASVASEVSSNALVAAERAPLAIGSAAVVTAAAPATAIAQEVQAIVQQQLEAFATQNFAWQGQVWPGQTLHWEIEDTGEDTGEDAADGGGEDVDGSRQWQTRLRLTLPHLGEVDARLRIQGKQIGVSIFANDFALALLRNDAASLRSQFEEAGLDLATIGIAASATSAPEG